MALGRELDFEATHYLRCQVTYAAGASAVATIGILPAGAVVLRGHAVVTTVFNAGTNNNVDVGIAGQTATFTSALAMTSVGVKPFTGLSTSAFALTTADTPVIATLGLTGTTATAGVAIFVIEYVINNDK